MRGAERQGGDSRIKDTTTVAFGAELPKIPADKGKSPDPNKGTRKGLTDPMDEKRGFKIKGA